MIVVRSRSWKDIPRWDIDIRNVFKCEHPWLKFKSMGHFGLGMTFVWSTIKNTPSQCQQWKNKWGKTKRQECQQGIQNNNKQQ
jgi:hypothetical protein